MEKIFRLINIRESKEPHYYIGRPSKLGNPFDVHAFGRGDCIRRYEDWLREAIKLNDLEVIEGLREAWRATRKGLPLGCFCAPKPCHGEVILKILGELERKELTIGNSAPESQP